MTLSVFIGTSSLFVSFLLLLWLSGLFIRLGNGRFVHFQRFFFLQSVSYGLAVASLMTTLPVLLLVGRILTPLSFAYLVWGMTRRAEEGP